MSSPEKMAAAMLRNLPDKTGKSLHEWHRILNDSGLEKHGRLLAFLKREHGVTHGFANLIVTRFLQADTAGANDLVALQYAAGKTGLRPIYDALTAAVAAFGEDVELAPKKTYVSLRRRKQFGLVQASTKTRVDVGLNLAGVAAGKRLEKSGSFNAMVSHRVRLSDVRDVDKQLIDWLKEAYNQAG